MDLALLSTWRRRWLADGLMLTSNDGCTLRLRVDQRPLRPFRELVGDKRVGELQRFITMEGEHAGLVAVAADHVVAIVVGDTSYTLIEAHTSDREREAWLRDLVHTVARFYPLGLGQPRRRRYMYRPPENWQSLARPGCTLWLAPDYPRVSGRITVFDARPTKWFAPGAVDRFLFVDENPFAEADPPSIPIPVQVAVTGAATRTSGRTHDGTPYTVIKAQMQDERYIYVAQLEARTPEWVSFVPVFDDVLVSIEPVPQTALEPNPQQFIHWIE